MGCTLPNTKNSHELVKWRAREQRALVEAGVKKECTEPLCTVQRVQPDRGHHCGKRRRQL
jgi:hypothetical protein